MIRTKKYFEDKLKEAVSVDPKVMVIQELENYFKDKSQNYWLGMGRIYK